MPKPDLAATRARLRKARMLRRSRRVWVSRAAWRPRLVFWAGALAIGLVSVAFAFLADEAQHAFAALRQPGGFGFAATWLLPPAGFALSAFLALTFFPNSQGSGIPQAIAARHLDEAADRGLLLSLRIAAGKIALTLLGLLCGASIGREGPTVQVGAAIMLAAGRLGGMAQARGLILAGSAAGIAAAFNTPLAGIVFAIEEMGRAYEARTNGLVLSAVVLAGLASLGLTGNYTYFGESEAAAGSAIDWVLVVACGILGGALGALFSAAALRLLRRLKRWTVGRPRARVVGAAALCGLLVAAIGWASNGATYGTGYEQARAAIEGTPLPPLFFAEKFAASLVSMVSGIPGGIFAPSLAVGAGLGSTIGLVLGAGSGLAATLGMAGYFAGVVQAPMTAFVIILEMTGNQGNVIPLMLAALLGFGTARLVSGEALYHSLSRNFVADVLRARRAEARHTGL
ncbi:chloride channel protein [Aureimonas pseudogalii]|uniref:H+/Cl- antiporter ClcA n=1 Tax=Aureimonas pseudogalii TaxID=1744844 RepID=A0A7W6H796_9HYPH|nr:chloride channel protein [Aureimonas pseudogalii]MBB3999812.1 H+/Cl- antiporter ClcA [Aureimonas pseudogalii]